MSDSHPKLSLDSFVRTTQKSGLVDDAKVQAIVSQLPDDLSSEAKEVARQLVAQNLITDWQAAKLLRGKHKGFSIGKYRLLRLLGKGGMSSVYLAEHTLMRRRCALKVLPIGRVDDSSWLARFHREAQAIAALDHPNIVRAYDIDHETDGERDIHFLVMEFVDGRSIQEIVNDDGPLSLTDAADYFRQAALGLDHAHRAGLVHRDVKPGNLLVDQSGVVKVLDLGLARFSEVAEEAPLTVTHDERILGTADYLSPEQALDSHSVDLRADIYSLGCSIYFALTGRPPFKDGSLAQRLMAHQLKDAPAIGKFRPEMDNTDTGRALGEIIRQMMARDPDERYQTMADVADTLSEWSKQAENGQTAAPLPGLTTPAAVPVAAPVVDTPQDSAPPAALPVAQPVTDLPPVAQPVETPQVVETPPPAVPVAVPVAQPVATEPETPVAKPVEPEAPVPVAAPAEPVAAQPIAAPPEPQTPVEPLAPEEAPALIADDVTPVAPSDGFDAGLIPDIEDAPDEFPSILGGAPTGMAPPQQPTDAQDFTQTETFVPQAEATPAGQPDFSALGDTPAPDGQQVSGVPGLEAAEPIPDVEFPVELPESDGPDELDRTIVTPAAGSSFTNVVPPPTSSAPVFPQTPAVPEQPAAEVPAFPAASAPFTPEPAPVAPPIAAPIVDTPQFAEPAPAPPTALPTAPTAPPQFPGGFDAQPVFDPNAAPPAAQPVTAQPVAGQFAQPATPQAPTTASPVTPRQKKSSPAPLIVSAVIVIAAIGGGAWYFMSGDDAKPAGKKSTAAKSSGGSKASGSGKGSKSSGSSKAGTSVPTGTLKTTLEVGPGREYSTIASALAYVRSNKSRYPDTTRRAVVRIELAGAETFNEAIEIDNSNKGYPAGIQITSTNEFPVTLKPSGSGPAIRLTSIENLQLDNLIIDASGMNTAIELNGFLNRTTLRNIQADGFTQTGILGKGLAGVSRDEVVIEHVDLRPADAAAVGIKLTSGSASTGRINVADCRLFGPQSAGILMDNGAVGIDIRRTIFDQADIAVSFAGGPQEWRDVRLVNNTFYQTRQAAIQFSDMPVTGTSGLEFRRNLFAGQKGPELKVAAGFDDKGFDVFVSTALGSVSHNWTDRSQAADPANGERDLIARDQQRVPEFQFFSVDRNADDFLTPQQGTPYSNVGLRRGEENDPFVGARPRPE